LKTFPLIFLSIAALLKGYITNSLFISYGSPLYAGSIFTHPDHYRLLDTFFSSYATLPLFFFSFLIFAKINGFAKKNNTENTSVASPIIFNSNNTINSINYTTSNTPIIQPKSSFSDPLLISTLTLKYDTNIFNHWVNFHFLRLSIFIYRYFDKGLLEILGPLGIFRLTHWMASFLEFSFPGFLPHLAFIFICLLLFFFLPSSLLFFTLLLFLIF